MLKINNLNVSIKRKQILEEISFELKPNKITVIVGKNGAGKSTIINCVNQMVNYQGVIELNGKDIKDICGKERAKNISILPQKINSIHLKVEELVSLGRTPYLSVLGKISQEDQKYINEAINIIGIQNLKNLYVDELSGGEQQKVYLAMLLAQNTEIIILDEPTTYIDMEYEYLFLETLKTLRDEYHKTIMVVMHDLNKVMRIADEIVILDKGKIVFSGSVEECLKQNKIEESFQLSRYMIDNKIFFSK